MNNGDIDFYYFSKFDTNRGIFNIENIYPNIFRPFDIISLRLYNITLNDSFLISYNIEKELDFSLDDYVVIDI